MRLRQIVPVLFFIAAVGGIFLFMSGGVKKSPEKVSAETVKVTRDIVAEVTTEELVRANNRFAFDLYRKMAHGEENLFFSPYSISLALTMTGSGASGETARVMQDVMHLPTLTVSLHKAVAGLVGEIEAGGKKGDAYELVVANKLWGRKGVKFCEPFLDITREYYKAIPESMDFSGNPEGSREVINSWVSEATRDKIKDLLPSGSVSSGTVVVLTNAIYFKSLWAEKFSLRDTKEAPFHTSAVESVVVPLMYQQEEFSYGESDEVQVLSLPYFRWGLSMVVLLPRESVNLQEFEKSLTLEKMDSLIDGMEKAKVKVYLPRFTITSGRSLKETLSELGMGDLFSESADFTGIAPEIFLSDVIHKAYVAVDEQGTEAAAATAVTAVEMAAPDELREVEFRADRPFMFVIRDLKSRNILFMGRVYDPLGK